MTFGRFLANKKPLFSSVSRFRQGEWQDYCFWPLDHRLWYSKANSELLMKHVFLSHNSQDKPIVLELAQKLMQESDIEPWLDIWNLIPGDPWQEALEDALQKCDVCLVCIGQNGIGPWQNEEMREAINRRVSQNEDGFRVIPVLLPQSRRGKRSDYPAFLARVRWVEFVESLEEEATYQNLISGIHGRVSSPTALQLGTASLDLVNPYKGLEFFDVADAKYFFGREALTEWLINEYKNENNFLSLIGASGSGKSSLARAGLLASLQQQSFQNKKQWNPIIFFPGENPLESLALILGEHGIIQSDLPSVNSFINSCLNYPRTLYLALRMAKKNQENSGIVLLIDQFEESFTLCKNDSIRKAFIDNLVYACSARENEALILITLRADFLAKCADHDALSALISDHNVLVSPMSEAELANAIIEPAKMQGVVIEPALVDKIKEEILGQAGRLPLLQDTLSELWNKMEGGVIWYQAYNELGGIQGTLDRRATSFFHSLDEKDQHLCKSIFLRLTQPGEGTEDTKRRINLEEAIPLNIEKAQYEDLIEKLTQNDVRLITKNNDPGKASVSIEVIHEALIQHWELLKNWISEEKKDLLIQRKLSRDIQEWKANSQSEDFLYTGKKLAHISEWYDSHKAQLNQEEIQFLDASFEKKRSERRQRFMAYLSLVLLLFFAIGTLSMVLNSERKAKRVLQLKEAIFKRNGSIIESEGTYRISFAYGDENFRGLLDSISETLKVTALDFRRTKVTAHDLENIGRFEYLSVLNFGDTDVDNQTLSYMKDLTSLTELYLYSTQVDSAGIHYLQLLTNLQKLNLKNLNINDSCLASLKLSQKIVDIRLSNTKIKGTGLEFLKGNQNLTLIDLDNTSLDDTGVSYLAFFPQIQNVWLSNTNISDRGLKNLHELEAVKWLDVSYSNITDQGLQIIGTMDNLERLSLEKTKISSSGLAHLTGLKTLKRLDLWKTGVDDDGLDYLCDMQSLREIWMKETKITDRGMAKLNCIENLETLAVPVTDITDIGVSHLISLPNLKKVLIGGTNLTDQSLYYFAKMENLESLRIPNTKITDQGLSFLSKSKSLKYLDLLSNDISVKAVKKLRGRTLGLEIVY